MSREKQIKKMSAEIREAVNGCSSYWSDLIAEHLYDQDYRKQSENTVELPCKIGQTVYMPWQWSGTKGVAILTINRIVFDFTNRPYVNTDFFSDDEEYWLAYNCGRFNFTDFGETVFLTRKEAEKALAKMKGGAE